MADCLQCPLTISATSRLHGCHHAAHDNARDSQSGSMNRAPTFLCRSGLGRGSGTGQAVLLCPQPSRLDLLLVHHMIPADTSPDACTVADLSGRLLFFK